MEKNGNGYKALWIIFWIFAVIVFPILFFLGNNVIANENKSIARDEILSKCIYNYIIPMGNDISAIKMKLDIK